MHKHEMQFSTIQTLEISFWMYFTLNLLFKSIFKIPDYLILANSFSRCFKATRTTMNLSLVCVVLIGINQIQGFYVPPKSSCIFSNDCKPQEVSKTTEQPMIRISSQPGLKSYAKPLFYLAHYPMVQTAVVKEMIDKILRLRNSVAGKSFRSAISRTI